MTLPTLDKTWQILPNQAIGILATGGLQEGVKYLLLAIKNRFIGVASGAWTVVGSSDSSSANMAGTDLWVDKDDLVWNTSGNAHSWIVLRNTAIASNFEICIDLNVASSSWSNLSFIFSHTAGFTGGTTTARPTATDEYVIGNQTDWGVGDLTSSSDAANIYYHIFQSTDGECTRVVFCRNRRVIGLWMFEKLKNPCANFSNSHIVVYSNTSGTDPASAALFHTLRDATSAANNKGYCRLPNGPTNTQVYLASEGTNQMSLAEREIINTLDLSWTFCPISIASLTAPNRGRLGELYDVWYGSGGLNQLAGGTNANRNGILVPSAGTKLFAMFDSLLLPWDGSSIPFVA